MMPLRLRVNRCDPPPDTDSGGIANAMPIPDNQSACIRPGNMLIHRALSGDGNVWPNGKE